MGRFSRLPSPLPSRARTEDTSTRTHRPHSMPAALLPDGAARSAAMRHLQGSHHCSGRHPAPRWGCCFVDWGLQPSWLPRETQRTRGGRWEGIASLQSWPWVSPCSPQSAPAPSMGEGRQEADSLLTCVKSTILEDHVPGHPLRSTGDPPLSICFSWPSPLEHGVVLGQSYPFASGRSSSSSFSSCTLLPSSYGHPA